MRVRTPRAGRRVPPVLHVAFLELPRRRPQDLRPRLLRGAVDQGHHVLELVAEAVGPARLVERRPAPDPAGQHLVEQPAVEHQVQGRRRASAPGRRPGRGPSAPATSASACRGPAGGGVGRDESPRLVPACPPGPGRRRPPPPGRGPASIGVMSAAHGSSAGPARPDRPTRPSAAGCGRRAVAAQELGAVGGDGARPRADGRRRRRWPAKSPAQALRASTAPVSASRSHTTCSGALSRTRPEHPLGVERRRQPPRPVAGVAHASGGPA